MEYYGELQQQLAFIITSIIQMQEFIVEEESYQQYSIQAYKNANIKTRNQEKIQNDQQFPAKCSLYSATKNSSKQEKKRLAGLKSREKKKKYIQYLQKNVKELGIEVQQCQNEISVCKDQLVQAIRNANNNRNNQHSFIFAELQNQISAQFPNLDLINLLIDQLRNRIGANGKQRQANLLYNFKQIINSMFPAIYRYFFYAAHHQLDIFADNTTEQEPFKISTSWTTEFYQNLKFSKSESLRMKKMRQPLLQRRRQAIKHMKRLKQTKQQLKQQGEIFQKLMHNIRQQLTPIQSALFTIFAEQNKFRKQFSVTEFQCAGTESNEIKLQQQ